MLCAVDDSNDHVLSAWDWQREDRLAEVKVCVCVNVCLIDKRVLPENTY